MSSGTFLGTVRASSWPALWDCAARYEFQTILGLRPPTQAPQRLGTAWHAATASFDRARMDGSPISIDDAAGVFVSELGKDSSSVQWTQPRKELESIGLSLTVRYCATLAPLRKYSAVELECSSLDVETPDGTIRLTGTTDRLRIDPDGKEGIGDLKSGKRAVGGAREGARAPAWRLSNPRRARRRPDLRGTRGNHRRERIAHEPGHRDGAARGRQAAAHWHARASRPDRTRRPHVPVRIVPAESILAILLGSMVRRIFRLPVSLARRRSRRRQRARIPLMLIFSPYNVGRFNK
jgi:hypothetical protein